MSTHLGKKIATQFSHTMRISAAQHVLASHTKTALHNINPSAPPPLWHPQRQSDHLVWSDQRWFRRIMNSSTLWFLLQKINSASWTAGVKFLECKLNFHYKFDHLTILHHHLIKISHCHLFKLFKGWLFVRKQQSTKWDQLSVCHGWVLSMLIAGSYLMFGWLLHYIKIVDWLQLGILNLIITITIKSEMIWFCLHHLVIC